MELWIRTPDKECLTKVDHLYISNNCVIKQQDDVVLAVYKTKERALEVLDEIEQLLKPKFEWKDISRPDEPSHYIQVIKEDIKENYVYEMPQE